MKELIDKFLDGTLNETEQNQFEELLETPDFAEKTYFHLILKQSFNQDENKEFLEVLKEVEQIHHYKQIYTLEELLGFFMPIKEYEENLLSVSRANEVKVVRPKNHVNRVDDLYFELNSPSKTPLLLIVENNEYDVLIRKEIPPLSQSFSLQLLPQKGFKIGRYYWKLTSKRHEFSIMGVFFIGKDLMPQS